MVLNLMIKILLILFLSVSMSYAKSIHEYNAYYPKNFKPDTCLAWHEGEGVTPMGGYNKCSVIIVCSGFKNGEFTQYETKADACKELKSPFVIKYKESIKDDVFYLDRNEVLKK